MRMDKSAATPLYSQLEVILEDKITAGVWDEGYQIPTENELADTYDVSNITVKRAIMNLVDKGHLVRHRGRGTFVTKLPQEKNIHKSEFIRITEDTSNAHDLLASKFQQTYPAIAKKLQLPPETKFVYLERIGYDEGENISLEYTYIPQSVWPEAEEPPNKDVFIYDVLKNTCGISLSRSKNYFSAAVANEREMSLIGVRLNTPLFVWERITYSTANEAIEYSKFIMKQDKEKYFVELDLT